MKKIIVVLAAILCLNLSSFSNVIISPVFALETVSLCKENSFKSVSNIENKSVEVQFPAKSIKTGDNEIFIKIKPQKGILAKDLEVVINAFMPSMPKMYVPKPVVKKVGKGQYKGVVNLSMPGEWQIKINLKEKNKINQQALVFKVNAN